MAEKHPKRPRDPNQLAKLIVDIATGEAEVAVTSTPGKAGGHARAMTLPKTRRIEIAKKGAAARWTKAASDAEAK